MRLIKMALLATTAAVAATAFIGASTASATENWIAVCLSEELLDCVNLAAHPLEGQIRALAGPGLFKANFNIECEKGTGESNKIESQQETALKGTLEKLDFEKTCTGGCKEVEVKTPQAVEINMTEAKGDWRLKSKNAKVAFSECTFGITCEFEGTLHLKVQMDAEGAYTDPEGGGIHPHQRQRAPLCGNTGKWEKGRTRFDWVLERCDTHGPRKRLGRR